MKFRVIEADNTPDGETFEAENYTEALEKVLDWQGISVEVVEK